MCLYPHSLFSSGRVKDQRVHSSEDLLLQETDDQLPDPTEHSAEVPVSTAERSGPLTVCITLNLQTSFLCRFCPFKEQEVHFYTRGTETSLKTLVSVPLLVCHVTQNPERRMVHRADPGEVCAETPLYPQVYLPAALPTLHLVLFLLI